MSITHTTWTFDGLTFSREAAEGFVPWFVSRAEYTRDAVLSDTTARSYIDLGATVREPLEVRAVFASSAARETFIGKLRTSGTLSNTRSRSATAVLVKAARVDLGRAYRWGLDLTFEYVSS